MAEKATEATTQQATGNGATAAKEGKKAISKLEAVRRSLEKLGVEASNGEIQADVLKRFGFEMTTNHVSTCKGDILRKAKSEAEAVAPSPKEHSAKPTVRHEKPTTPAAKTAPTSSGKRTTVELDDILAVKEMVKRMGSGNLKTLIEALEK